MWTFRSKRTTVKHLSDRRLLELILEKVENMANANELALANITAKVTAELNVTSGLRTLLGSVQTDLSTVKAELAAAGVDPGLLTSLDALSSKLGSDVDANAAALLANTPAATVPPDAALNSPPVDVLAPPPADPSVGT